MNKFKKGVEVGYIMIPPPFNINYREHRQVGAIRFPCNGKEITFNSRWRPDDVADESVIYNGTYIERLRVTAMVNVPIRITIGFNDIIVRTFIIDSMGLDSHFWEEHRFITPVKIFDTWNNVNILVVADEKPKGDIVCHWYIVQTFEDKIQMKTINFKEPEKVSLSRAQLVEGR